MRKKRGNRQNPVQTSARAQERYPNTTLGGVFVPGYGAQTFARALIKSYFQTSARDREPDMGT